MANKRNSLPLTPASEKDRMLGGRCLGCLQSETVPLTLSICLSTHKEPGKTCSFCPGWHHLCLTKAGSEEVQKCNWCNSYDQLGISAYKLPIQCLVAVGAWMANNKHTMPPVEFHTHTLILASRLFECNGETFDFTLSRDKKAVTTFPKANFFEDILKKATAAGDVKPLPWAAPQEGLRQDMAVQEEGGGDGDVGNNSEVEPPEGPVEASEEQDVEGAKQQCAGAADDAAPAGTPANPTPALTQPAPAPAAPADAPLAASNRPPRHEDVKKGDLIAVQVEDGSGEFKVGRIKQIGQDGLEVAVATGADHSGFSFLHVSNNTILDCCTVVSNDAQGIIGGQVKAYELCNTKSPVNELLHANIHWQTFGILGFKFCGHDLYFAHR